MAESTNQIRLAVGVMTGTSIDGMDAALVRIEGEGLSMRAELVQHVSVPLGDLQPRLRAAANQQPMAAGEFAQLAWDFGVFHADVIEQLLTASLSPWERAGVRAVQGTAGAYAPSTPPSPPAPLPKGEGCSLICIHGQTVFHQPPISWQLGNPAPIAARFKCPIVSDLRQADLAHGGQGAPITPIADWVLFRDEAKSRAIVNLGGFCNVTIVPRSKTPPAGTSSCRATSDLSGIRGFDVCACNQLLDAIARESLGKPFDEDGAAASRGHASPQAADELRAILDRQRRGRRSLGTGDEALQWIHAHRAALSANDLAASAVQAIAHTILAAIDEHSPPPDELILAGGGARNLALRGALSTKTKGSDPFVLTTADLGVPLEAREAMCFAVLGALCQDGAAITLPQVTGCASPAPISGTWSGKITGARRV